MSDKIHAKAVASVEDALKLAGIYVAGFSGAVVHTITEETCIGGNTLSAGQYVAVEFKAIVPITL